MVKKIKIPKLNHVRVDNKGSRIFELTHYVSSGCPRDLLRFDNQAEPEIEQDQCQETRVDADADESAERVKELQIRESARRLFKGPKGHRATQTDSQPPAPSGSG